MNKHALANQHQFKKVDKEIIDIVYNNNIDFNNIHVLENVVRRFNKIEIEEKENTSSSRMGMSQDTSDNFLRNVFYSDIKRGIPNDQSIHQDLDNTIRRNRFPGPMAAVLNRKDLPRIYEKEYFITEKSDGIRVLMLSQFHPHIPKIKLKGPKGGKYENLVLNLTDTLNIMYQQQKQYNGPMSLSSTPNMNMDLVRDKDVDYLIDNETKVSYAISRRNGMQVAFFCDRTFAFYMCTDELLCLTLQKKNYQKRAIFDGEILFNEKEQKYNFYIFDMVSYTDDQRGTMFVNAQSMSQKIHTMKHIINQSQAFYKQQGIPEPQSLGLRVKHFYPKHEISTILKRIKKDPTSGDYYYNYLDANNKNDGLIFTPGSSELYIFIPGTSLNLVKWKWSEKLTVDFYLQPCGQSVDPQCPCESFNLYYGIVSYPSKKKLNIFFGHASYAMMTSHISPVELQKLHEQLQRGRPVIAECYLDLTLNCWVIELIRVDKVYPNDYLTALSTVVTAVENINKRELEDMLDEHGKQQAPNYDFNAIEDEAFVQHSIQQQFTVSCRVKYNEFKRNTGQEMSFEVFHQTDVQNKDGEQWTRVVGDHDEIVGPDGQVGNALLKFLADKVCHTPIRTGRYKFKVGYVHMVFVSRIGKYKVFHYDTSLANPQEICSAVRTFRVMEQMHMKAEVKEISMVRERADNKDLNERPTKILKS